jgi:hypothetical protein
MKIAALLFLSSFLLIRPCYAKDVDKKVDDRLGEKLIELLFDDSRKPGIEEVEGLQENFLVYTVIGEREGMKSDYGVNPWTGDVWDLWECKRISTPSLQKAQGDIRKRYSPEELGQYNKLHMLRPVNVGLDPC